MRLGAALVAAWLLLGTAPAAAQTPGSTPTLSQTDPNALVQPPTQDLAPAGHLRSAEQVVAVAGRVPKVRDVLRRHPGASHIAYLKGSDRWQVSYYAPPKHRDPADPTATGPEIAQVIVQDATGRVLEAWTGFQVAWTMARGYPGAFGRRATALYIWLPLCALFIAPFVSLRRPWRLLHLDLLAVLAFSVSLAFFSHGTIGWSVPLAYPPLVYLLVRMLAAGWRGGRARAGREPPLRLAVPVRWLTVALVFLVAFRIGLNAVNSNVIDVGYAGVIGADRIAHGERLYGNFPKDNEHGDTYGPFNYEAYVPFERVEPWSGRWDDVPAAHVAAGAFDLLTLLGLWLLGRRIRGPSLGVALAYAWAACPFTLFALSSNSNDALVAALVTFALLAVASPPARGALAALAGLTKFAPLALAPLLLTYRGGGRHGESAPRRSRLRTWIPFALAFAVAAGLALVPALVHGGSLATIYDRTLGYQAGRGSPFSVWGFVGGLGGLQTAVQAAAVALALLVAVRPRRKDVVQVAALAAAVLIALQLGVTHWFYLYIVWFLPLVLVALLGGFAEPAGAVRATHLHRLSRRRFPAPPRRRPVWRAAQP